jgi:uncharacterized membrane protein YeiH
MLDIGDYYKHIFDTASIAGSIAFALSGFLVGARKHMDIMGVFILAFLTANGGGILRDLLVDRPPAIMTSMLPFWIAAGTMAFAMLFRLHNSATLERGQVFIVSDAVGLVAFGITGALIGIEKELHFFGVVTLSFLTATGGGIIRDVLVKEVPLVLHSDFYGCVALFLGVAVYLLHWAGLMNPVSLIVIFAAGFFLRLIAHRYSWKLPKLR